MRKPHALPVSYSMWLFKLLTASLIFGSTAWGAAPNSCKAVHSMSSAAIALPLPEKAYGTLKKDFKLDPHYKVEVPDQSEIVNQCSLGTCHLHAWAAQMEKDYKARTQKPIKISTHYQSAKHWLRTTLRQLEDPKNNVAVSLGATTHQSRSEIVDSGSIPDEVWKGSRKFANSDVAGKMAQYLQNIIARTKWEMSQQTNSAAKQAILEKGRKEINEIFETFIGPMPEKFTYQGVEYTPQTFQAEHFPELQKPLVYLGVSFDRRAKTVQTYKDQYHLFLNTSLDQIEATARALLDQGRNVYLAYEHNSSFVDMKSGIMSIAAFEMPVGGGPLPRIQRDHFSIHSGGHAVQIVGYDVDPRTNKVSKWKIKNSWGVDAGDKGFFHMYADYFRAFLMSISYFDGENAPKPAIDHTNPEQLNLPF